MSVRESIFPILKVAATGDVLSLAGTGFLVAPENVLVTAKHVFEGDTLDTGEYFAIGEPRNGTLHLEGVHAWAGSRHHDLAVVRNHGVGSNCEGLELAAHDRLYGWSVLCEDFSNTEITRRTDGTRRARFNPQVQKGNIVGPMLSDQHGDTSEKILTSFPALQGASGAPLIFDLSYDLCGMMVANYERHLLPAQIVRVDGETEEVRYFMPFGVALSLSSMVDALTELNVHFTQRPDDESDESLSGTQR